MKAVIIDDESNARETLRKMLAMVSPEMEIVGEAKNGILGKEMIDKLSPDLVFLDIEMPEMNGFEMLQKYPKPTFKVIFVTAYNQYAVKAFRFSAIDYLLKPISPGELLQAIEKIDKQEQLQPSQVEVFTEKFEEGKMEVVEQKQKKEFGNSKLALSTAEGLHLILLRDIIWCESLGSYTKFHIQGGQKLVVSRPLKDYEELLEGYNFFRIHQSSIVNLEQIKKYVKGDGGQVWMTDNSEVEVSRRKKEEFLEVLSHFYIR